MPTSYDPNKAEAYNKLIQSGLSEDAAFAQSGITEAEAGNYALGSNGQLGATIAGSGKVAGVDYDNVTAADAAASNRFTQGLQSSSKFEQVDYAEKADAPPSSVTPSSSTTTDNPGFAVSTAGGTLLFKDQAELDDYSANPLSYTKSFVGNGYLLDKLPPQVTTPEVTTNTESVSGGGSTTIIAGPREPNTASRSLQPAIDAKQAEIDQFIKDNPSDFARKNQGLPPLTPAEKEQRQATLNKLSFEKGELKNQQFDAETLGTPSITTDPNTTTTTQTVTTGFASTNQQVDPETDQNLSQQNEIQLAATPSFANASSARTAAPVDIGLPPVNTAPTAAAAQELLKQGQGGEAKENLENIVLGQKYIETSQASIQQSQASISENQRSIDDARAFIAQNNAELADENITDARRAELEANNAENAAVIGQAEQNIESNNNEIRLSQSNIYENELIIDANADGYQAYAGVGITPPPVPVDSLPQTTVDEFGQVVAVDAPGPGEDPFEAERLRREQEFDANPQNFSAEGVSDIDAGVQAQLEFEREQDRERLSVENFQPAPVTLSDEEILARQNPGGLSDEEILARQQVAVTSPAPVTLSDEEILARQNPGGLSDEEILARQNLENPDEVAAAAEKAAKFNTTQQATLQSRYKQPGNQDWRVRISLSANATYLYNDPSPGILARLKTTNGVVFPYTPSIETSYVANYEKYDLVHSNYRGAYYKNSAVNDINIRGIFTAQDTNEAEYMLAVIHFFRSVTKMFYGKDSQRGAPPPLVYLTGFGDYQFAGHPCVVTNFSYSLPSDVDYIRANNPNNYGTDLLNRRAAALSSPTAFSGQNARQSILAAVGIPFGATPAKPTPGPITNSVTNTERATYVPTKIEINVTLLPMQTRDQISQQFSLKEFANGKLIQGGFW